MAANLSRTNTVAGTDLSGALDFGSLAVIRSAVIHLIDPFCCIPPNDMRTAFRQRIDAEMWESAGSLAVIRSAVIHLIDPFCCIPPNDMRTAFRQRIDAEMWESAGSRIHFRLRGGV